MSYTYSWLNRSFLNACQEEFKVFMFWNFKVTWWTPRYFTIATTRWHWSLSCSLSNTVVKGLFKLIAVFYFSCHSSVQRWFLKIKMNQRKLHLQGTRLVTCCCIKPFYFQKPRFRGLTVCLSVSLIAQAKYSNDALFEVSLSNLPAKFV